MQAKKIEHKISKAKQKVAFVAMNIYQQAECVFWWLSNSFRKTPSALSARIVDKPVNVAPKCVKTGDLAIKNAKLTI